MTPEERATIVLRAKAELRKRARGLRQTTPAAALAKRSEQIVERLRALPALASASHVALFWPIEERHEVDLRALDAELRARAATIAYPCIDEDAREMTFRVAAAEELVLDPRGFRGAPVTAPKPTRLDAIVLPALALDEHGRRLGYGSGFYDQALARWPDAKTVGVAYDFQLLVEVPTLEHDRSVEIVVTDARTIVVGDSGSLGSDRSDPND